MLPIFYEHILPELHMFHQHIRQLDLIISLVQDPIMHKRHQLVKILEWLMLNISR